MNPLDTDADKLLARSIAEGRLSAKPSLTTLNRIAGIIAPVLSAMPAPVEKKRKVA